MKVIENLLRVVLVAAGALVLFQGAPEFAPGEMRGLCIRGAFCAICFSASFDPINALWICLPNQVDFIRKPHKFKATAKLLFGLAVLLLVAGLAM